MRSHRTGWNRSYKGPTRDTDEAFAKELRKTRRHNKNSEANQRNLAQQKKTFRYGDGDSSYSSKTSQEQFKASRRKTDEIHAERELASEIREVWE